MNDSNLNYVTRYKAIISFFGDKWSSPSLDGLVTEMDERINALESVADALQAKVDSLEADVELLESRISDVVGLKGP